MLVDVVLLVRGGQHLALVDEVDLERFQDLGLGDVSDPALGHHRDRDRFLDALDHRRIAHARDPAVAADVGGNALERHHRRGTGALRDRRLFRGGDVHDHATLQHLRETDLEPELLLLIHLDSSSPLRRHRAAHLRHVADRVHDPVELVALTDHLGDPVGQRVEVLFVLHVEFE